MPLGLAYPQKACWPAASLYPALWDEMCLFVAPCLGNQGRRLFDCSPWARTCNLTTVSNPAEITWESGPLGPALYFASLGSGSGVTCGPLDIKGPMTLVVHFRPGSILGTAPQFILAHGNSTQYCDYALAINYGTAARVSAIWGDAQLLTSSTNLALNNWYSVALRRSGVSGAWTVDVWLNGVKDGSNSVSYNPTGSNGIAVIGAMNTLNLNQFYGWIDAVGIWRRALSPGEIGLLAADPIAPVRPPAEDIADAMLYEMSNTAAWAQYTTQVV